MFMCPSIPTQERNSQCEVGEAGGVQTVCILQGSEEKLLWLILLFNNIQ